MYVWRTLLKFRFLTDTETRLLDGKMNNCLSHGCCCLFNVPIRAYLTKSFFVVEKTQKTIMIITSLHFAYCKLNSFKYTFGGKLLCSFTLKFQRKITFAQENKEVAILVIWPHCNSEPLLNV